MSASDKLTWKIREKDTFNTYVEIEAKTSADAARSFVRRVHGWPNFDVDNNNIKVDGDIVLLSVAKGAYPEQSPAIFRIIKRNNIYLRDLNGDVLKSLRTAHKAAQATLKSTIRGASDSAEKDIEHLHFFLQWVEALNNSNVRVNTRHCRPPIHFGDTVEKIHQSIDCFHTGDIDRQVLDRASKDIRYFVDRVCEAALSECAT